MVQLNYRDARPIYTQIIDGFRDQILAGVLQKGDRLPSVRELAQQGWIATVPGKGCFICGVPQMTPKEQQPLLESFDKAAAALLALGVTREELIARIQGGQKDA